MLSQDTQWLTKSPNKRNLHEACAEVCRSFGFQCFLFISKIPDGTHPRLVIIQGASEDGSEVCHEHHGVLRLSSQESVSSAEIDTLLDHFTGDHKQQLKSVLLGNQINIPLVNSMSFPITGKKGDVAILILSASIDSRRSNTSDQLSHAQEFTHRVHQAVIRLARNDHSTPPKKLTRRELECLHWAAAGKTNWEVGKILGISKRTVVFHLQNSAIKLQTSNRYHTVARAVSLGLVRRQD